MSEPERLGDAPEGGSPPFARSRSVLFGALVLLCFGVLGLLWLVLGRGRRQRRCAGCAVCRRHRRIAVASVSCFGALLVLGAGVRTQMEATPVAGCDVHLSVDGEEAASELEVGPSSGWWGATRQTVTAPISGVALMATHAAGMDHCSGSAVVVAFVPPVSAESGGSVVGNVFVTWIPESGGPEVALPGQESYVRFGPAAQDDPAQVESIARHESRHVDQWTVATLLGGPLALPTGYSLDSLLFPMSRNHFERHAGLADGGYEAPADYGPRPLWLPLTIAGLLAVLALRRRIRWSSRVLSGGRSAADAHEVDRCPLHTRGWFRAGSPR